MVSFFSRGRRWVGLGSESMPGLHWPATTPEAVGMSLDQLAAIPAGVIGDAVCIRHGSLVWAWGNPLHHEKNWASSTRGVVVCTVWGVALTRGDVPSGLDALDRPIVELGTPAARLFDGGVRLEHLLRYTGHAQPPGSAWVYSGGGDRHGKHWTRQPMLFRELTGWTMAAYFNSHVAPVLSGLTAFTSSDGTPRFTGSVLDAAKWSALMLSDGGGLIDPAYVRRALTPGPNPVEAFGGIHLIRGGQAWELNLPGVPDGFMARSGGDSHDAVIGIPSLGLIVSAKSGPHSCEAFLPRIVSAVTS